MVYKICTCIRNSLHLLCNTENNFTFCICLFPFTKVLSMLFVNFNRIYFFKLKKFYLFSTFFTLNRENIVSFLNIWCKAETNVPYI